MKEVNYPVSTLVIRRLVDTTTPHEKVAEVDGFIVVRFERPWDGFPFWVVSAKGFMWEPAETLEAALEYLESGAP